VKILEETQSWRLVESPLDIAATVPMALPVKDIAARLAQ
jgi:hypothetical protein